MSTVDTPQPTAPPDVVPVRPLSELSTADVPYVGKGGEPGATDPDRTSGPARVRRRCARVRRPRPPPCCSNLERYATLGIAGISIGSNDLTQLLLGADRDSETLSDTFDERDPVVTEYLRQLIPRARGAGRQTSICGQAPSVHPECAELLVRAGIDALSGSIDVVDRTRRLIAAAEQRLLLEAARPPAIRQ